MKKGLAILLLLLCFAAQITFAKGDDETALSRNLIVLTKGSKINYPIQNGTTIICYARRLDGSVDAFNEYNDYFYMKDGVLYSDTMNKVYKPEKTDFMKKVDNVSLTRKGETLQLYDPLWEWSVRRHRRMVKINTSTGEYYMKGTQHNWVWYRNAVSTGYCQEFPQK